MTPEQRAAFEETGYHVMPGAISGDLLARLQAASQSIIDETRPAWLESLRTGKFPKMYGWGPAAQTMLEPHLLDTVFLDVANNETILDAVKATVGPYYQLMIKDNCCHRHPAGTDPHTVWHTDWSPYRSMFVRDMKQGRAVSVASGYPFIIKVKVILYVQDCDESMGAFAIVPGSQRYGKDAPMDQAYVGDDHEKMPGMKKLPGKAGDAIIYDVSCWHSGTRNSSTRDRIAYILSYMPFWVKNWESESPHPTVVNWADTPYKRQLAGIHSVHGRLMMNRSDVPYLPEHLELNKMKRH